MKQLSFIKYFVLGLRLKTIITMTNILADLIFDVSFYFVRHA